MALKRVCRQATLTCLYDFLTMLIEEKVENNVLPQNSLLSDVINIIGDFVKSETPQEGAYPLSYDAYKMNNISLTMVSSMESMLQTVGSKIGPLLEHAGTNKTALGNFTMPSSLASQLYNKLFLSNVMVVCNDDIFGCDLFDDFEAKRATENKKAQALRSANSVGNFSFSFASFLSCILLFF